MKQQVARFSPHQNGKAFGVLMAVVSLILMVPFGLLASVFAPSAERPPVIVFLLLPLFYLVFGYVSVAVGCALYNVMFGYLGGIEFEARVQDPV